MRYLLFSGGLAIAGALVERAALGTEEAALGFTIGFAAGLAVFRTQLRALWWPTLAVSRDAVYLIRRKQASIIPWQSIAEVLGEGRLVTLRLASPLASSDGSPVEQIQLEARKLGTAHAVLLQTLQRYAQGRSARMVLPDDARVRRTFAVPP